MNSLSAPSERPEAPLFSDGLGDRVVAADGATAAERLIVTPHARLVVAEHVVGSAVEQLQFNRERLWQELRVAMPATAGPPRFDHRADVTAMGLVALALILGRPLRAEEYPQRVSALLGAAVARSALGEEQPLPASLRGWVARAVQIDPRNGFASALEAQTAFEEVLFEDSGFVAAPVALETFLSRYITALLEPVVDTSAAKPAVVDTTVVKPAYAEPSSFSAPASAVQVTADIPATKPSRNDMAALKAEFVEALAETPEPDSVQAATAWLPSRVPSEKPAVKKAAAEVSARRTATTDAPAKRVVSAAPPRKSVVTEPGKPAAANPSARVEAPVVKPAAPVATTPIEPPDITELLRSIDASSAPLRIEPSRFDEERMFEPEPAKTRSGGSRR